METRQSEYGKQWVVCILSEDDIKEECKVQGWDYAVLTKEDKGKIADHFQEAVVGEYWTESLSEAISDTLKQKKKESEKNVAQQK